MAVRARGERRHIPTIGEPGKAPSIGYELNLYDDDHYTITREEYHRRQDPRPTPGRAVPHDKRHTRGRQ